MKYYITQAGRGFLNELSKELYKRAADKAEAKATTAAAKAVHHAEVARGRGEVDWLAPEAPEHQTADSLQKLGPHGVASYTQGHLAGQRKEQSDKFRAASKKTRTRRPAREYPLGALERDADTIAGNPQAYHRAALRSAYAKPFKLSPKSQKERDQEQDFKDSMG